MIDSHCHLADETYAGDLDEVIRRARDAGVERALVILAAGDAQESAQAVRVGQCWPEARFGVGVHPHAAHTFGAEPGRAADAVRAQLAGLPSARAIGEIGLDYHYDYSPRETQQDVFRAQVALAVELGLPVIIHTREAEEDTVAILRDAGGRTLTGVLHCFTGTPALRDAALDLGFYVSLAGIITFPKAQALRETARAVPVDRILTETDSPFLAPVPYRGRRNEPAHVARVVAAVAELKAISVDDAARATSANFHALFRP